MIRMSTFTTRSTNGMSQYQPGPFILSSRPRRNSTARWYSRLIPKLHNIVTSTTRAIAAATTSIGEISMRVSSQEPRSSACLTVAGFGIGHHQRSVGPGGEGDACGVSEIDSLAGEGVEEP